MHHYDEALNTLLFSDSFYIGDYIKMDPHYAPKIYDDGFLEYMNGDKIMRQKLLPEISVVVVCDSVAELSQELMLAMDELYMIVKPASLYTGCICFNKYKNGIGTQYRVSVAEVLYYYMKK